MGYNLHITRAKEWLDSEQHPILESEWLALVHADPTLAVDTLSYSNRQTVDGTIERDHPVIWLSHPDSSLDSPAFWYEKGRIFRKAPDDSTLRKMLEIAGKLNARILGDDEEEYYEAEGKIEQREWDG